MPRVSDFELPDTIRAVFPAHLSINDLVFVCIGTDRSTGDSLGPLVGTTLVKFGYTNVIGTVNDTCHAMNLDERIAAIPDSKTVIAIDSALSHLSNVGLYGVWPGPINPGSGVGKKLPPVGDYRVTGIVNVGGFMEYVVLQNTRLSLVMKMAEAIAYSLMSVFPLLEGSLVESLREVAAAEELLV